MVAYRPANSTAATTSSVNRCTYLPQFGFGATPSGGMKLSGTNVPRLVSQPGITISQSWYVLPATRSVRTFGTLVEDGDLYVEA